MMKKPSSMKNGLFLLLLFFSASWSLTAQSFYTVHVGTFRDVRPQDFSSIKPLGFLYSNQLQDRITEVFLGNYQQRNDAVQVANALRQQGYQNAEVWERPLSKGQTTIVIQLATRYLDKGIEWDKMEAVGDLYALVDGNTVKVVTGTFSTLASAEQQLAAVRKLGYTDAFVKRVNSAELVEVTEFESGIKKDLIPIRLVDRATPPPAAAPTSYEPVANEGRIITDAVSPTPVPVVPANELPLGATISASTGTAATTTARTPALPAAVKMPQIRGKVKRGSALALQTLLKQTGFYTGSLDGYYGAGTTAAYERAVQQLPSLQKYRILAANIPATSTGTDGLQRAINELLKDPSAYATLTSTSGPVADMYRAYYMFARTGPSLDVNNLMNRAIQAAFAGNKSAYKPPFDTRATYSYQDVNQLLLHLHYISALPAITHALPCWLYDQHPQAASRARDAVAGVPAAQLNYQSCESFTQWPEVQWLQTIAQEASAGEVNQQLLTEAAAQRAQLYLTREPLSSTSATQVQQWDQALRASLDQRAAADPLYAQLAQPLSIMYHQTQVRLEDFYMDKGFSAAAAKDLSLATLQALVGAQLARFL